MFFFRFFWVNKQNVVRGYFLERFKLDIMVWGIDELNIYDE